MQSEQRAVLITASCKTQLCAMIGVQAPADSCPDHPGGQAGQIVLANAEPCCDRRYFKQIDQFAHATTLLRQCQQPVDRPDERRGGFGAEVGYIKRNVSRIIAAVLTEDGTDRRSHLFDVWNHHDDVARLQGLLPGFRRAAIGQQTQEVIVKDLKLADFAVRNLEANRTVARREYDVPGLRIRNRHQITNVVLHLPQQRGLLSGIIVEEIDLEHVEIAARPLCVVKGIELAYEIPALASPGGEQRICVVMHFLFRDGREIEVAT